MLKSRVEKHLKLVMLKSRVEIDIEGNAYIINHTAPNKDPLYTHSHIHDNKIKKYKQ